MEENGCLGGHERGSYTMKYDFTSIMDRTGKDSIAVENIPIPGVTVKEGFSRIPMWVADMGFRTVPTIVEEVIKRAQHPAFGYFSPSKEYFDSIIRWTKIRHGVEGLTAEDIGYEKRVLGLCRIGPPGIYRPRRGNPPPFPRPTSASPAP